MVYELWDIHAAVLWKLHFYGVKLHHVDHSSESTAGLPAPAPTQPNFLHFYLDPLGLHGFKSTLKFPIRQIFAKRRHFIQNNHEHEHAHAILH